MEAYNVQIEAQSATLATTKTASPAFPKPGDTVTYTMVTTNSGSVQADNVVITDAIPAGTTFVSSSVTGAHIYTQPPQTRINKGFHKI